MKLKTPYKTVMFYGNALRINVDESTSVANWRDSLQEVQV